MSTEIAGDQTSFYSLLNLTALGVVCAWAFYVWTFQQFHGGHIVEPEYHTLWKTYEPDIYNKKKKKKGDKKGKK